MHSWITHLFHCAAVFPKDVMLDGEVNKTSLYFFFPFTFTMQLFGGRSKFNETVSIVRSAQSKKWSEGVMTYQVFDIISMDKDTKFEDRLEKLKELFGPNGIHKHEFVVLVEHKLTQSREHLLEMLKDVEKLGGEGLMIRKPASYDLSNYSTFINNVHITHSLYEGHRSSTLMKIKTFYDAEAEVTGYEPGKGKHSGSTGALKCKMASGKVCQIT